MRKALVTILLVLAACVILQAQDAFYRTLADSAFTLTRQSVIYDGSYRTLSYPGGDVPADRGVCTDVVIRAYRKMAIDLQKEVHEDMAKRFGEYPQIWGLKSPDSNIDHRRVPNLMTFFDKFGKKLPLSTDPIDYSPGDIVCWDLGGGITHIGIVSAEKSISGKRYLIIHNIGAGQVTEDCLFSFKIIGHYQYRK